MQKYKNLSGKSNVVAFEIRDDSIVVVFKGKGSYNCYLYTYASAGKTEVEKMKTLALSGRGLGGMLATKPYHKHEKSWRMASIKQRHL